MKVSASLNNLRISSRKVSLVSNLIKNLDVEDALNQLENAIKKTSPQMKKLLLSAIANSENNFGLDKNNLYVFDVVVGAGPTLKRWMPRAYGRAGMIRKRTSNVTIILEERIEGKGRKSKEELEKERKKKAEERKKLEQERERESKTEKKDVSKKAFVEKDTTEEEKKKETKKNWTSKIFRRKSM
jgi:large subunit ribosomal protein L22